MNAQNQYEVALSFAGEQREYVEKVARALQNRRIAVFYDAYENLWGKNLAEELQDVFENRADYVVIFISKEYIQKEWTIHERKSIMSRAVKNRGDDILPVRFDDTTVPGLPTATHYKNACDHTPAELAVMIAQKLGVQPFKGKASDVPAPRMTSLAGEAVFDYGSHNGRYIIGYGNLEFETKWNKSSNVNIHIDNDPASIYGIALARECTSIGQILNAESLDYTSRVRIPRCGEIVVLRNINGFYAAVHVLEIKDDTRDDDRDELRFRYVIQANGSDDFTEFDKV